MQGKCHICGQVGKLSFEHIPPQSAYNNQRIFVAYGRQLFEGRAIGQLDKKIQQGGAGHYSLCAKCNSDTGGWYGRAYVDWVKLTAEVVERAKGAPILIYPFRIYPLRVIKQIVTMFFSVNSPEFREKVPYLEKFVLDKFAKGLPPDFNVYAAYTLGTNSRSAGVTGLLNGAGFKPGQYIFSEISFPPFTFILTLDSPCPDGRLINITDFSLYGYDDIRIFDMRFPNLPVYTAYPADYRGEAEVAKAIEAHRVGNK